MTHFRQKSSLAAKLSFQFLWIWGCLAGVMGVLTQQSAPNGLVGGSRIAAAYSAPFIVSFQEAGIHYCAGSLVNSNWAVTAAKCLTNSVQVLASILVAGSLALAGTAITTQRRSISYFVIHDLYVSGTSSYDIGLVYTPTAFVWSSAVAPVTLPESGVMPTGNANLFGWGSMSTIKKASDSSVLQVASKPFIEYSSCQGALGSQGSNVLETNVCTGPLSGGVSACIADSGGPLAQGNTLTGVVSWGYIPCGQVGSPSVYVKVSSFNSWISDHVGE